jgi:hypothetical protein
METGAASVDKLLLNPTVADGACSAAESAPLKALLRGYQRCHGGARLCDAIAELPHCSCDCSIGA